MSGTVENISKDALAVILDLLQPGHLVALLGPSGAGKTVLALHVALEAAKSKSTVYVALEEQAHSRDFLQQHPEIAVVREPRVSGRGVFIVDGVEPLAKLFLGDPHPCWWEAILAAMDRLRREARASDAAVLALVATDVPGPENLTPGSVWTAALTVADAVGLVKPINGWSRKQTDGYFSAGPGELLLLKPLSAHYPIPDLDMSSYVPRYDGSGRSVHP